MAQSTTKKRAKKIKKKAAPPQVMRVKSKDNKHTHGKKSEVPEVRVRMYRQGLGDCFLITFNPGVKSTERHMLIDCGTLGNKTTSTTMDDVAKHIAETIEDSRLHVVVATHEHKDHLSGFNKASLKALKGKVDHVWLAWTEDPSDKDARALAKNKKDLGTALAAIAAAAPGIAAAEQVKDLLGFAGEFTPGLSAAELAADFAKTIDAAMDFVRTGLGAKAKYHEPGDLIEEPWLPGFRIYVLGPPRAGEALKNLGGHNSEELYGVAAGLRNAAMLHAAAANGAAKRLTPEEKAEIDQQLPFDARYNGRGKQLRDKHYPEYNQKTHDWRTIENDWLNLASDLALQLDSMTNNTSLALAIERVADGKVLLFPADAQQGNWLSWHDPKLKWSIPDAAGKTQNVTVVDILARTVFYKVGHHCSHNATARAKGLELMLQEAELTAFIPVDRTVALSRNPKDSWQMPARPLYRRLLQKCQGRVARSDTGWADDANHAANKATEMEFDKMATSDEWKQWRRSQEAARHVRVDELFVEYTLH